MMHFIFLVSLACVNSLWAKAPKNYSQYFCHNGSIEKNNLNPSFLNLTKDNLAIGICGTKDVEVNNFIDFSVEVLSENKNKSKPIFSNHSLEKKFLVLEKHNGLLLIEKVKIDNEYVELFKHEIACNKKSCVVKKETCLVLNKVKQKWITKSIKDLKIKNRMKKSGC